MSPRFALSNKTIKGSLWSKVHQLSLDLSFGNLEKKTRLIRLCQLHSITLAGALWPNKERDPPADVAMAKECIAAVVALGPKLRSLVIKSSLSNSLLKKTLRIFPLLNPSLLETCLISSSHMEAPFAVASQILTRKWPRLRFVGFSVASLTGAQDQELLRLFDSIRENLPALEILHLEVHVQLPKEYLYGADGLLARVYSVRSPGKHPIVFFSGSARRARGVEMMAVLADVIGKPPPKSTQDVLDLQECTPWIPFESLFFYHTAFTLGYLGSLAVDEFPSLSDILRLFAVFGPNTYYSILKMTQMHTKEHTKPEYVDYILDTAEQIFADDPLVSSSMKVSLIEAMSFMDRGSDSPKTFAALKRMMTMIPTPRLNQFASHSPYPEFMARLVNDIEWARDPLNVEPNEVSPWESNPFIFRLFLPHFEVLESFLCLPQTNLLTCHHRTGVTMIGTLLTQLLAPLFPPLQTTIPQCGVVQKIISHHCKVNPHQKKEIIRTLLTSDPFWLTAAWDLEPLQSLVVECMKEDWRLLNDATPSATSRMMPKRSLAAFRNFVLSVVPTMAIQVEKEAAQAEILLALWRSALRSAFFPDVGVTRDETANFLGTVHECFLEIPPYLANFIEGKDEDDVLLVSAFGPLISAPKMDWVRECLKKIWPAPRVF